MFTKKRAVSRQTLKLMEHLRNANGVTLIGNNGRKSSRSMGLIDHANGNDLPMVAPNNATLGQGIGNPQFIAQFDITMRQLFFTVNAGVYTQVTQAAVIAAQPSLNTKLSAFLFGQSDFNAGFPKLRSLFPLNVWAYDNPFIYGIGQQATLFGELDATIKAQLEVGDLVIPFTATLGGVDYLAVQVIHCDQVGYGSLLAALSSDNFTTNMIRYVLPAADIAQYQNNIRMIRQSLFGKSSDDKTSPNSFKIPEQQQDGIVDVPLRKLFDKESSLGTYINSGILSVQWSIFVSSVVKAA